MDIKRFLNWITTSVFGGLILVILFCIPIYAIWLYRDFGIFPFTLAYIIWIGIIIFRDYLTSGAKVEWSSNSLTAKDWQKVSMPSQDRHTKK